MTNMSLTVSEQFIFFLILAVFVGLISTAVCWLLLREKRRTIRIYVIIALAFFSFGAFYFRDYHNLQAAKIIVPLIAILWFPAAIILAGHLTRGLSGSQPRPVWVFVTSIMVYMTEFYFGAYLGPFLGLRSLSFLILIPPPELPFAWLQIPEIYKVIIQFFVTFILAYLIFWLGVKLSCKISGKNTDEPSSGDKSS